MHSDEELDTSTIFWGVEHEGRPIVSEFVFQILHNDIAFKDALTFTVDEGWYLFQRIYSFELCALKVRISHHLSVD